MCPFCAEETCQDDVRRAFSQHGEMGYESDCRGIGMLYGDYRVVYDHAGAGCLTEVVMELSCVFSGSDVAAGQVLGYRTMAE